MAGLGTILKAVGSHLNPFDGGANYGSVMEEERRRKEQQDRMAKQLREQRERQMPRGVLTPQGQQQWMNGSPLKATNPTTKPTSAQNPIQATSELSQNNILQRQQDAMKQFDTTRQAIEQAEKRKQALAAENEAHRQRIVEAAQRNRNGRSDQQIQKDADAAVKARIELQQAQAQEQRDRNKAQTAKQVRNVLGAPVDLVRGAAMGAGSAPASIGSALSQGVANTIDFLGGDANDEYWARFRENARKSDAKRQGMYESSVFGKKEDDSMVHDLGAGAGRLVLDAGVAAAVPGGSLIVGGAHGAEVHADTMNDALDKGQSVGDAYKIAAANAATQAVIEKVGLEKLLGPGGKSVISNAIRGAMAEGLQEGTQQFADNAYKRIYDQDKELLEGIPESMIMGALLGGPVGGINIRGQQGKVEGNGGVNDTKTVIETALNSPQADVDLETVRNIAQNSPSLTERVAANRVLSERRFMLAGQNATGYADAQAQGLVFDGVDGKPRFEVDDSGMRMASRNQLDELASSNPYKVYSGKITDVVDHPVLFKQYPDIADVKVHYDAEVKDLDNAWFDPVDNEITIGAGLSDQEIQSATLHELQHWIQEKENFARGGSANNVRSFVNQKIADATNSGDVRDAQRWRKLSEQSDGQMYNILAGEAEARAVEARMDMPMSERYVKPQRTRPQPTDNDFQNTLPSATRPAGIKSIVDNGGNPLFHDTDSRGVLGIIESGELKPSQAPFSQLAGQGKRVSTTRNFDNYSRYGKAPYRFIIDERKTGQKAIPDNREEFESIFNRPVSTKAVESLSIDITNPALINDLQNGTLKKVIDSAEAKGIRVEVFEGKLLPDVQANKEIQEMTRDLFAQKFPELAPNNVKPTFYDSLDVPKEDLIVRNDQKLRALDQPSQNKTTEKAVTDRSQMMFGDKNVSFHDLGTYNGVRIDGYYADDMISLSKGNINMDTFNHESVHRAFDQFIGETQRQNILDQIIKDHGGAKLVQKYRKMGYGNINVKVAAEEELANGFIKYANAKAEGKKVAGINIPPKFLAYFDRVWQGIKSFVGKADNVQQLYAQLESGKFRNAEVKPRTMPAQLADNIANHPEMAQLDETLEQYKQKIEQLKSWGRSENYSQIVQLNKSIDDIIGQQRQLARQLQGSYSLRSEVDPTTQQIHDAYDKAVEKVQALRKEGKEIPASLMEEVERLNIERFNNPLPVANYDEVADNKAVEAYSARLRKEMDEVYAREETEDLATFKREKPAAQKLLIDTQNALRDIDYDALSKAKQNKLNRDASEAMRQIYQLYHTAPNMDGGKVYSVDGLDPDTRWGTRGTPIKDSNGESLIYVIDLDGSDYEIVNVSSLKEVGATPEVPAPQAPKTTKKATSVGDSKIEATYYHGTQAPINSITDLNEMNGSMDSLFGPGVYLTDNKTIAQGYSQTRGKDASVGKVLEGGIGDAKLYSLEDTLPADVAEVFAKRARPEFRDFPEDMPDFAKLKGTDAIREIKKILGGRESVDDFFTQELHPYLIDKGYDGFSHIGGIQGGDKHNVAILFNNSKIARAHAEAKAPTPQAPKVVDVSPEQHRLDLVNERNALQAELDSKNGRVYGNRYTEITNRMDDIDMELFRLDRGVAQAPNPEAPQPKQPELGRTLKDGELYSTANSYINFGSDSTGGVISYSPKGTGSVPERISYNKLSQKTRDELVSAELEYKNARANSTGPVAPGTVTEVQIAKDRLELAQSNAIEELGLQEHASIQGTKLADGTRPTVQKPFLDRYTDWLANKWKSKEYSYAQIKDMEANPSKYKAQFESETSANSSEISQLQQKVDAARADLNNPQVDSRFAHEQLAKAQRELDQASSTSKPTFQDALEGKAIGSSSAADASVTPSQTAKSTAQDAQEKPQPAPQRTKSKESSPLSTQANQQGVSPKKSRSSNPPAAHTRNASPVREPGSQRKLDDGTYSTKNITDADISQYVDKQVKKQQAEVRVGMKDRIVSFFDGARHALVDDAVAHERYIKDKTRRAQIREGIDRVRGSDMIARHFAEENGLKELGKMKTADLNEFQQYLIAKRAQELEAREIKTGRNSAVDRAMVKKLSKKYEAQERIVRDYSRAMLDYSVEGGLISKELRDSLLKENPNYVPMNRVMDSVEQQNAHKSKQLGSLSKQSVVKKIEGSERTVDNPIESLMKNTLRMANEVERNKVATMLATDNAFKENIVKDGDKIPTGYDTIAYLDGGEKVRVAVPKLVATEMRNLNGVLPDWAETTLKILGAPTKLLRAGATGANPIFTVTNVIRDQLQTTITGSVRANIKGTPKAFMAAFAPGKKGAALRRELQGNGIVGNEYRQTYGYKSGQLMKELQRSNNLSKQAVDRLRHPIDSIADLIGRTEYFTRAQQYYGTSGTVTQKAQAARNNSLNFSRAGAVTRVANRVIPFINAAVQGGRITVNQFHQRPVRTSVAFATFAGLAMAARALNEGDEERKALWDRIGDEEKKTNLIIFSDDARYDKDTNRVVGVTKIPMPQMLYPVMDAVNNTKGKPEDFAKIAGDIFTATTGLEAPIEDGKLSAKPAMNQLTPTFAKPAVEASLNKSLYTGNDLVSEYDKNQAPEDQGKKYTSGVARDLAKVTGWSAPVIDNFIGSWGGGVAKDLTKALSDNPDNAKDGKGIAGVYQEGFTRRLGSASVTSQYEIQEKLAEEYKKQISDDPAFKQLTRDDQVKVLDKIDSDTRAIAGVAAKTEQGKSDEIKRDLSARQKSLVEQGFNPGSYLESATSKSTSGVEISKNIDKTHKTVLEQYNNMDTDQRREWFDKENDAEYKYELAKYNNNLAENKLSTAGRIKAQKSLRKSAIGKDYSKNIRDLYSLSKADLTDYLTTEEEGVDKQKLYDQLVEYDRKLKEAGVTASLKFKTGLASGKGGKSGGKGGSRGTGITAMNDYISTVSSLNKTLAGNVTKMSGKGFSESGSSVKPAQLKKTTLAKGAKKKSYNQKDLVKSRRIS